ncbi:MAG: cytochrome c-type biosis protein CcmH [Actinomycetota bacterium]
MTRTRVAWLALAAAVLVAVVVALTGGTDHHATAAQRADAIAHNVRCPTCRGQSVAESASPAAQAIRTEVRRRIDAGQSRQQIEAYLETRYGSDILLTPPRSGIGGLVWIVPVVAVVVGGGALVLALQRWSRRSLAHPSDEDRALVARAEQR